MLGLQDASHVSDLIIAMALETGQIDIVVEEAVLLDHDGLLYVKNGRFLLLYEL